MADRHRVQRDLDLPHFRRAQRDVLDRKRCAELMADRSPDFPHCPSPPVRWPCGQA